MKPGARAMPRAVDGLVGIAVRAVADERDAALVGGDIGHERRRTAPVIDLGM